MRFHRFFIDEQLRNKSDITLFDDAIIHQLKDVFRFHTGDKLILLDNSGYEYISEISLLAKGKAEIKIVDSSMSENLPEKTTEVWLLAALVKKDNFEWILEKCTEIGVSHFVPVVSARSEKKDLNQERAEKIIREAAEQSGRGIMPVLHEVMSFEDAISEAQKENVHLASFHVEGEIFTHEIREKLIKNKRLGILIGPEGGWSEKEIEFLKEKNIPIYSLGKQILRAETAAAITSALLFFA
jgi:16S rRNA (uracil1498-N3)-methyltransferase